MPRARARNRAQLRPPARELDQRFRRRADHGEWAQAAEIHVWRGIDEPQSAIHLEWIELVLTGEAGREHQLVDVASRDVFLHPLHALHIGLALDRGARRREAT